MRNLCTRGTYKEGCVFRKMKFFLLLLLCVSVSIGAKMQVEMIGPQRLFVDISETNSWIDPGVICSNGTGAITPVTIDFTVPGQYTIEYNCHPNKMTRSISVGPAACSMLWNPVCCSSKIYSNDCEAYADACLILTPTTKCVQQTCTVVKCLTGSILVGRDKNGCGGFCLQPSH